MRTAASPAAAPVAMPVRRIAAVLVGGILGAGAFAGLAAAGVVTGPNGATPPVLRVDTLVERPGCATATRGATAGDGVGHQLSVAVRPTALIGLDGAGRVVDAWTNTGCAPRATDDVYVRTSDGAIRPAARGLTTRRWTGDFREPGVAVVQATAG